MHAYIHTYIYIPKYVHNYKNCIHNVYTRISASFGFSQWCPMDWPVVPRKSLRPPPAWVLLLVSIWLILQHLFGLSVQTCLFPSLPAMMSYDSILFGGVERSHGVLDVCLLRQYPLIFICISDGLFQGCPPFALKFPVIVFLWIPASPRAASDQGCESARKKSQEPLRGSRTLLCPSALLNFLRDVKRAG